MYNGIDIETINNFIKKNDFYSNSIEITKKSMSKVVNELNLCYEGRTLEYLFSEILAEQQRIETLTNIVKSYSDTLYRAGVDYQKQDLKSQSQISHANSNL